MTLNPSPPSATAFLRRAVDCDSFILFAFSFFIPPHHNEEAEKWESRSQTPLYCQFLGLQQLWELEESLLLSNTFAPCVKDKEHHAWLWGPGSPVPHEL